MKSKSDCWCGRNGYLEDFLSLGGLENFECATQMAWLSIDGTLRDATAQSKQCRICISKGRRLSGDIIKRRRRTEQN